MSDEIINQAISESTAPAIEQQPIENPQTEVQEEVAKEEIANEAEEAEDVPFPKKAVKALSRRDRQIGKLQAERAALTAELTKFREQTTQQANNPPKESDFDNYGELLKAQHRHEWQQEQAAKELQQKEQYTAQQEQQWFQQRNQEVLSKAQELKTQVPDFLSLLHEYSDVLSTVPAEIERVFYEVDAPEVALYALAKEGRLEEVLGMSPSRVAIELGKAEIRGEALIKQKQITKTPAPIEGLKGVGSSNKQLDSMNHDELMAWVNKR